MMAYGHHGRRNPEFFDDGDEDEDQGEAKCRYCGADGLEWVNTGMRFRLVDAYGKFHECRNTATATAEDFDSAEAAPAAWCPICGGKDGEHKSGCEPEPGGIL